MSCISKNRAKLIPRASTLAIILILLFAEGSFVVFTRAQGTTQTANLQYGPTILSGAVTTAKEPAISTSADGKYVFVAWTQGGGGIYFASSGNSGASFSSPKKISTAKGAAAFPVMVTSDGYESVNPGDVYVAWAQPVSGTLQIFVASSINNGSTFDVKQLSSQGGITPAIAASGSAVYVSWNQNTPCPVTALNPLNSTTGLGVSACNYVDWSTNSGATWQAPVELNPSVGGEPQIVASGNYAYFVADLQYFSSFNVTASNWDANTSNPTGWSMPMQYYYYYAYDPGNSSAPCTFSNLSSGCLISYGREPWVAASGLNVYLTFEAVNLSSTTALYSDYGITSNDGGLTWYPGTCNSAKCPLSNMTSMNLPPVINNPSQQAPFSVSRQARDTWEPENVAFGATAFVTMHSLSNQAVYVSGTSSNGSSWSSPVQVNVGLKGTSSFAHIFTSDGVNVWVIWGQQTTTGSVWNAYVAYSNNGGASWSSPIDISNNKAGVAAGNQDVTLFWVSSIGTTCYTAWTYTNGGKSQIMFAEITG